MLASQSFSSFTTGGSFSRRGQPYVKPLHWLLSLVKRTLFFPSTCPLLRDILSDLQTEDRPKQAGLLSHCRAWVSEPVALQPFLSTWPKLFATWQCADADPLDNRTLCEHSPSDWQAADTNNALCDPCAPPSEAAVLLRFSLSMVYGSLWHHNDYIAKDLTGCQSLLTTTT